MQHKGKRVVRIAHRALEKLHNTQSCAVPELIREVGAIKRQDNAIERSNLKFFAAPLVECFPR